MSHRFWGNPSLILENSVTDFGEIRHRKSATGFGEIRHRLWEAPFLGETCSVFGRNTLRFWGEQAPFLGKTGSVFGTKWFRFGEKVARFGESWLGFRIGLRQSSSLTVLNTRSLGMFGFGFLMFWASPKIWQVGRAKCSNL